MSVPSGTIDPRQLGCGMQARIIFEEHAAGKTVPEIAECLMVSEDLVRAEITGVWYDEKHSAAQAAGKAGR